VASAFELPAHAAPLGILYYSGSSLPSGTLLVAEHGSVTTKVPTGYRISMMNANNAQTNATVFADGFLLNNTNMNSAWARPVDIIQMRDGSLLMSDDKGGSVIRFYKSSGTRATISWLTLICCVLVGLML